MHRYHRKRNRFFISGYYVIIAAWLIYSVGYARPQGISEHVFSLSMETYGTESVIQFFLQRGYGVQYRKDTSGYRAFIVRGGRRQLIQKGLLSGHVSPMSEDYLDRVDNVVIHHRKLRPGESIECRFRILYCEFERGICFQKKVILTSTDPVVRVMRLL